MLQKLNGWRPQLELAIRPIRRHHAAVRSAMPANAHAWDVCVDGLIANAVSGLARPDGYGREGAYGRHAGAHGNALCGRLNGK